MQIDEQLHPGGGSAPATEEGPAATPGRPGPLVRAATADLLLLVGVGLLAAGALARDVVTSGRPVLELALALGLGLVFGVFLHWRLTPGQEALWRPAPPVPSGAPIARTVRALPRAVVVTLACSAVVVAAAFAWPQVGLALVLVGLTVALLLRVVALLRWERDRGRLLYIPAALHPLPRAYRSRPRL